MKAFTLAAMATALVLSAGAASAEPSLAETAGFIRDRVAEVGPLAYTGHLHDSADNTDWSNSFRVEASNVTVDPGNCAISFHWRTSTDGATAQDFESGLPFGDFVGVRVTSMEEDINRLSAKAGHPTWTARVDPPLWVVTATQRNGSTNSVDFRDHETADRVARAIAYATELCGGPKRDAF